MRNYWVLERKYLLDLINDVENYIETGWKPFGGAFTNGDYFYQTIVRDNGN